MRLGVRLHPRSLPIRSALDRHRPDRTSGRYDLSLMACDPARAPAVQDPVQLNVQPRAAGNGHWDGPPPC